MAIDPRTGKEIPGSLESKVTNPAAAINAGVDAYRNQGMSEQQAYEKAMADSRMPPKTETSMFDMPPRKEPTVATPSNPLVTKGGKAEESVTSEIPVSRASYESIIAKDPLKLNESEKGFLRVLQSRLSEGKTLGSIFGEESAATGAAAPEMPAPPISQGDLERRKAQMASTTDDLVEAKRKEIQARQVTDIARLEKAAEKVQQARQSVLSFSGFGRSTYAADAAAEIQDLLNQQVEAKKAADDLELRKYQAERQGADAETLAAMQKQIDEYSQAIYKTQLDAYGKTLDANNKTKATMNEAVKNVFDVISESTKEKLKNEGYEDSLSKRLGYAVDKNGKPLLDEQGNRIVFQGDAGNPEAVESYAQEVFNGRANISSVPDDKRDSVILRVAGLRKESGRESSYLNQIKAENLLSKVLGRQINRDKDAPYLGYVENLIDQGYSNDEIARELGTANAAKNQFIAGNQKLFDDMQKDAKDFDSIRTSFNGIQSIVEDALQRGNSESKAALDQALITLFNKMLDPGSVVREGEYDRTAQGQAVIDRAYGMLTRLSQGGAAITDAARKDMLSVAETLYKQAQKGMNDRRSSYVGVAGSLGADPQFVKDYFEGKVGEAAEGSESVVIPHSAYGAINSTEDGTKGGQCGRFVNNYMKQIGADAHFGDSLASKEKWINSSSPSPGSVIIMSSPGKFEPNGHVGFVTDVLPNGDVVMKSSNYKGDERVTTDIIKANDPKVKGYYNANITSKPAAQKQTAANQAANQSEIDEFEAFLNR